MDQGTALGRPLILSRTGESEALRGFLAGDVTVVDAADAAGLTPSAFLDLVERTQAAERAVVADEDDPAGRAEAPEISVVVPVYNEEDNLDPLLAELLPVLATIGSYQVVFVDDGSTDRSRQIVLGHRDANPSIELVELARNFGHQAALTAGIDAARGRCVVLMDADLQDPPNVLPELVSRWRDGYDVVFAIRHKRKEGVFKRASYCLFYRLLRRLADVELPVDSGDFCLMDRKVVDALRRLPESSRFLRGLRGWLGFRQVGVPYERSARHAGEPKYTTRKLVKLAVDGLLSFSTTPLRLASLMGFLTTLAALCYLLWAVAARLFVGDVPPGWTSIVFVLLILGGIQLTVIGVLGEYLALVYRETKRRPPYVVGAVHGADQSGQRRAERSVSPALTSGGRPDG
jgi:dolichol-phosphate mannosyltransferase